ncbi:hypothetical protein ACFQ6Q_19620 [Streptomyces sp. NPDC056437]|uniref:hypothetical protein n=1 Tax=Streptomyces sp. NPDC056437 TaxID=3345816 RepID=UPI0036C0F58B
MPTRPPNASECGIPSGHLDWVESALWDPLRDSPIAAATVRRRSSRAVEHGITPLWVTSDGSSALIDLAPWVLVDDQPWH